MTKPSLIDELAVSVGVKLGGTGLIERRVRVNPPSIHWPATSRPHYWFHVRVPLFSESELFPAKKHTVSFNLGRNVHSAKVALAMCADLLVLKEGVK